MIYTAEPSCLECKYSNFSLVEHPCNECLRLTNIREPKPKFTPKEKNTDGTTSKE